MIFVPSLGLIDAPNFGPARTFAQQSREFGKLPGSSYRIHFYAPVIIVANPASNSERLRRLLDKIAESDALYVPTHAIESR